MLSRKKQENDYEDNGRSEERSTKELLSLVLSYGAMRRGVHLLSLESSSCVVVVGSSGAEGVVE